MNIVPEVKRDEAIKHYSIPDILPGQLALDRVQGILAHLLCEDAGRPAQRMELFTQGELSVLVPLLEAAPHYCPYAPLVASWEGNMSEQAIDEIRSRLDQAVEAGLLDSQMRPVRNALSRVRLKLAPFRLDILAIFETGYILSKRVRARESRHTHE